MWTTAATVVIGAVVRGMADHFNQRNDPNSSSPQAQRNSSSGYAFEHSPASSFNQNQRPRTHRETDKEPPRFEKQTSTCSHCSNVSSGGKSHCGEGNKPGTNNTLKTNRGARRSNVCFIKMPDDGNYDVRIKKSGSNVKMTAENNFQRKKTNHTNSPTNGSKVAKDRYFNSQRKPANQNNNSETKNKKMLVRNNDNPGVSLTEIQGQFDNLKLQDHQKHQTRVHKKGTNSFNVMPQQKNRAQHSENKTWMYVGRLTLGTNEAKLKEYLTAIFHKRQFEIKKLPLYREGKLPCFKVLVDNDLLNDFQDKDHWPSGVKITKFYDNFKK